MLSEREPLTLSEWARQLLPDVFGLVGSGRPGLQQAVDVGQALKV
jgi:hypothetical protein